MSVRLDEKIYRNFGTCALFLFDCVVQYVCGVIIGIMQKGSMPGLFGVVVHEPCFIRCTG